MTIDVFADIACPWCYLGERRLFAALDARGLDADVRWHPFQLQPDLPASGLPWRPFAEQKFGGWERARAGFRHLERAAEGDGIAFDFEGIASAANTTDAHRLILWAREHGREWAMAEALFSAYFVAGQNLNEVDTLVAITESVGLDGTAAADLLAGDALKDAVAQSQHEARRLGISGVPFTILDGRLALSGAQPVDAVLRAFDELATLDA